MTTILAVLALQPGFQLSATLPRNTFLEGESLGLTIALRNAGDASVTTIDPTDDREGHVLRWRLVRADGTVAWASGHRHQAMCCSSVRSPRYVSLEPNETLRWTETVIRDVSLPDALRVIPPGKYKIELAFRFDPGIVMPPNSRRRVDWSVPALAATPWFVVRPMESARRAAWDRFQSLIDSNRPIVEQLAALRSWKGDPDLRYRVGVRIASLHARRGEYDEALATLTGLAGLPRGGDDLDWRRGEAAYFAGRIDVARVALERSGTPRAKRLQSLLPGSSRP
jgi:hypothetical protein